MTQPAPRRILVIEDDKTLNRLLCDQLQRLGHAPKGVESRADALTALAGFHPELAILDIRLPDADGMTFLPELREYCPVIVLTAFGSIDQAVQVVRAGAADFLVKPITAQSLDLALNRFFDAAALKRDLAFWQAEARRGQEADLSGASAPMVELRRLVTLFAGSDTPVVILGESGTGKERTALALHGLSPRSNGRFVSVDCEAGLAAAELFGELGTGGAGHDAGLIAAPEAGTIFLGGVDRLPADMQAKLLRVVETGSYRQVGSSSSVMTQARFILSSSLTPAEIEQGGTARNELLFRLSAFTIRMPPLRERPEDIIPLAENFLQNRSFQRNTPKAFDRTALEALRANDWPGNVRELQNAVERAIIMSSGDEVILPAHLGLVPRRIAGATGGTTGARPLSLSFETPPTMDELRDTYLRLLLERHDGNRRKVAEILGISERNTYRLIQKLKS